MASRGCVIRETIADLPPLELCKDEGVTHYTVVIHEEPEGGYWAEVPAQPGCYSEGDSIPELMSNLREAITGVLEVLREQGREPESNVQVLELAV